MQGVPLPGAMAANLGILFKANTAAQARRKLFRERRLMVAVVTTAIVVGLLPFIDIPGLHEILAPIIQTSLD